PQRRDDIDRRTCGPLLRVWQTREGITRMGRRCRLRPSHTLILDNGQEFSFAFALAVQALAIRHRYIKPAAPNRTAKSNGTTGSTRNGSGPPALRRFRYGRGWPPRLGATLQPRTLLNRSSGATSSREACDADTRCRRVSHPCRPSRNEPQDQGQSRRDSTRRGSCLAIPRRLWHPPRLLRRTCET